MRARCCLLVTLFKVVLQQLENEENNNENKSPVDISCPNGTLHFSP